MTQTNRTMTSEHTLVGLFSDTAHAEQAINDLKLAGFTPNDISVVTKHREDQRHLDEAAENDAGKGTLTGSLGGGTLGAVLGWLLAGGTALIPGIGPVAAAGIFGATVTGALVGGAVGGISGALAGAGVPHEEASAYEESVKGGNTLVAVQAANGQMVGSARDIFERNNAFDTRYYHSKQDDSVGRSFSGSDVTEQPLYPSERTYNPTTPVSSDSNAYTANQSMYANADSASMDDLARPRSGVQIESGAGNYDTHIGTQGTVSTPPTTGSQAGRRSGIYDAPVKNQPTPGYESRSDSYGQANTEGDRDNTRM